MSEIHDWKTFIGYLSNAVEWQAPEKFMENAQKIEGALVQIANHPEAIGHRGEEILENAELFERYQKHCNYPRVIMDKFILYMDPENRFRVRLHRFKTRAQNGGAVDRPHSHKWPMCTIMLRGSYTETVYDVKEIDERTKFARITPSCSRRITPGMTNSLDYGCIHQTDCDSDEPAITLFVRGPDFASAARIYPIGENRYYETYGPDQQLRVGYREITRLNPLFH
jgi:hypothetical protein